MAAQPFTPKSFCAFAASLTERWQFDDSAVRTTMSRAYYGALIEARDACGLSTKGLGGHKRVIDEYLAAGTREGAQIARDLGNLQNMRESADYEPCTLCTPRQAYQAVQLAEKVLIALGTQPEPPRPKLVPKAEPVPPPPANA